jgi:hypothetical protein
MADMSLILQQDGDFLVEVNCNGNPETTNGFLMRRCGFSLTSPEGLECVGGYNRTVDEKWVSDIHRAPADEDDSDIESLGSFDSRDAAVAAMWEARHRALTRHPRY